MRVLMGGLKHILVITLLLFFFILHVVYILIILQENAPFEHTGYKM